MALTSQQAGSDAQKGAAVKAQLSELISPAAREEVQINSSRLNYELRIGLSSDLVVICLKWCVNVSGLRLF